MEEQNILALDSLVSIIIPIYNVQDYLPKCLDSLISQTYKNIEIILVDDGSLDNSLSVCKQYVLKDSRIQLIMQKNAGVTAARMNGFTHSNGNWIMFVDADDYVSYDIIERMVQVEEKYQVDMISCQYFDTKKSRSIPAPIRPEPGYYDKERIQKLLARNFLYDKSTKIAGMTGYLWAKLFKRCYVQGALEAGEGLIHSEDQIGIFKTLYSINSMYVMEEVLYYYVVRKDQATNSYNALYWKNFENFFERIQEIDQKNYLEEQIPIRVVMILTSLLKMEFMNDKLSIFQRYNSIKRNFSEKLCLLGRKANFSAMGWKARLQYFLVIDHKFILYGFFIFFNGILKKIWRKSRCK